MNRAIIKEPYSPFVPRRHERHIYWLESLAIIALVALGAWKLGFAKADRLVDLIDRPVAVWAESHLGR